MSGNTGSDSGGQPPQDGPGQGGPDPQQGGQQPQQGGYPPQQQGGNWGPQSGPPQQGGKRGLWIGATAALAVAALVAGYFVLSGDDDAGVTAAGEIFLEPAAEVGPDPFYEDPLAGGAEENFQDADPGGEDTDPATEGGGGTTTATTATSGGEPGLYGGTNDKTKCDIEQLKAFLTDPANSNKAQAWVTALNADPRLNWPGGQLAVADIPAYLDSLSSLVLTSDMRVTNHGYRGDGQPTVIRQSVLQSGMAVLVDPYGVARVKCFCGNPLIGPLPQPEGTKYVNDPWPGFDPGKVIVVTPPPEPLDNIEVKDPNDPLTLISHPLPPPGGEPAPEEPAPEEPAPEEPAPEEPTDEEPTDDGGPDVGPQIPGGAPFTWAPYSQDALSFEGPAHWEAEAATTPPAEGYARGTPYIDIVPDRSRRDAPDESDDAYIQPWLSVSDSRGLSFTRADPGDGVNTRCGPATTREYDDGRFVGTIYVQTNCQDHTPPGLPERPGERWTAWLRDTSVPDRESQDPPDAFRNLIYLQGYFPTDADTEVWRHALSTMSPAPPPEG